MTSEVKQTQLWYLESLRLTGLSTKLGNSVPEQVSRCLAEISLWERPREAKRGRGWKVFQGRWPECRVLSVLLWGKLPDVKAVVLDPGTTPRAVRTGREQRKRETRASLNHVSSPPGPVLRVGQQPCTIPIFLGCETAGNETQGAQSCPKEETHATLYDEEKAVSTCWPLGIFIFPKELEDHTVGRKSCGSIREERGRRCEDGTRRGSGLSTVHFQSPFAKVLLILMVLPADEWSEQLGGEVEIRLYERKQSLERLGRA